MANKRDACTQLADAWGREASDRERRVERADPQDTPALRRTLTTQANVFRRCADELRRQLAEVPHG